MVSIDVQNASVDFPIFDAKNRSLKKSVLGRAGGHITDAKVPVVEALRDVSLSLRQGDRVGLVGHNGAGKSTLLRLLAGIYEPTRGRAKIQGRVAPVFDLAVGMDPEISGLENILIRGLFLGMSRKEMERRVDEIADFTELGDYLTMPLRTYSTGMRVRLALGVVTSIDPEILILDEGIGAVDAAFLEKARDRLRDLVSRSGMLVFASHSDEFLVELCDTAIWMDTGEIKEQGSLREVVSHYKGRDLFDSLSAETLRRLDLQPEAPGTGTSRAGTSGAETSGATGAATPESAASDATETADETVGLP